MCFAGQLIKQLRGHFHGVFCCAFNHGQTELLSGGGDRNILIWDSNRGQTEAFAEHLTTLRWKKEDTTNDTTESRSAREARERLMQDTWSSDEENDS